MKQGVIDLIRAQKSYRAAFGLSYPARSAEYEEEAATSLLHADEVLHSQQLPRADA